MPESGCGCAEQHMHIHEKRASRASETVLFFLVEEDFLRNTELFTTNEEDSTGLLLNQTSCFPSLRHRVHSGEKHTSGEEKKEGPQLVL